MKFSNLTYDAASKNQRLPSKNPDSKHEKPSFELLAKVVPETFKTHRLLRLCLVALPPKGRR